MDVVTISAMFSPETLIPAEGRSDVCEELRISEWHHFNSVQVSPTGIKQRKFRA